MRKTHPDWPDTARSVAFDAIAAQAERFPDLVPLQPETGGLDGRDAALAHVIYDSVIRRWLTLSRIVEAAGGRQISQLEPVVQATLLGGAAQLILLDRVPDHAAIDESVEWVKVAGRPMASGMVNAILRKVIKVRGERRDSWNGGRDEIPMPDGTAIGFSIDVIQNDPIKRLSSAASVPQKTLKRWAAALGEDQMLELAMHTLVQPPAVVLVGYAKAGVEDEEDLAPHRSDLHRVFAGPDGKLGKLLDRRQDIWVQDEASCEPVRLVRGQMPGLIVDLCAGQGTKTRQLAAEFPEAMILATDVDRVRLKSLGRTFAEHDRVTVLPYTDLVQRVREGGVDGGTDGGADLVLLDVPCSNTGVLPRRLEAKYRADEKQLERMKKIQREIVDTAMTLLAPEGVILYSTCSLEREENEDLAHWACETHGLRILKEHRTWPSGFPGDGPEVYRDGSFGVVLSRGVAGA